jgi:ABC-type uncharacterized transport system involved in gliding motility auxiliary subunit
MCPFNSAEHAYLKQKQPNFTLKHLSFRKYSFQNLNRVSQGNNVLDDADSNIDDFVWRDTCVSSTLLSSPIC